MIELVERALDEVLPKAEERPAVLHEAMRYAVGTGGKRIRPQVCLAACKAVGGQLADALYPACAIELLHNYTLIHDDLPAMDNDRERRGKPTVWVKYGEANAILAGDALLALAYRTAARAPRNVAAIVDVLGEMGVGVVQGQVEDIASQTPRTPRTSQTPRTPRTSQTPQTPRTYRTSRTPRTSRTRQTFIYTHKTADLFMAAAVMGGLAGGGRTDEVAALRTYALNLGLAFQYEDDLLDGDSPLPQAETECLVRETTDAAVASLAGLSGDTTFLRDLAQRLVGRTS